MKGYLERTLSRWVPAGHALVAVMAALLVAATGEAGATVSSWDSMDHARVRLVAESDAVGTTESVRLGLHFQLDEGWKIYWRSPGDAGIPPQLDWADSENLADLAVAWPAPQRFSAFGLQTAGYSGEVVLPLEARLARPGDPLSVRLGVDYLVCEEICVPASARLTLDLTEGPAVPSPDAGLIEMFAARIPGGAATAGMGIERVEAVRHGGVAALRVVARAEAPFADPDLFIEPAAGADGDAGLLFGAPDVRVDPDGRRAVLLASLTDADPAIETLAGRRFTLTLVDGPRAVEVGAEALAAAAADDLALLAGVLGLALVGGLILNLMPCVLPVLSLKLLSVVGHGGAARGAVRAGFLASAAGILFSFLALAAVAVALKSAGVSIGWGIQFQQPLFLAAMTLLVVLFACNLWGFFEIRMPRLAAAIAERRTGPEADLHGLGGHFLTGAFATLLATPCSAPFLGTAVGFAFARGAAEIFAIFTALGIGLALPYLLVAAVPRLATLLPRPGAWMVTMKRVLGLALAGTGIWLISVLATQQGVAAATAVAIGVLGLIAVLWAGRHVGAVAKRRLAPAAAAGLAALTLAASVLPSVGAPPAVATAEGHWQPFDREAIPALLRDGKIVFVDVTADWCLTCQVNKSLVLDRGDVAAWLRSDGVVAMRADWTRPDEGIARYLESFGRYGIPFNAVYGPGTPGGLSLPELLTVDAVVAAVEQAGGQVAVAGK
jgi:suppressor for copper-sensitivity B